FGGHRVRRPHRADRRRQDLRLRHHRCPAHQNRRDRRAGHLTHPDIEDFQGDNGMTTAADILAQIKEKDVKYVDVRFTDIRGRLQHVTFDIDLVDDDFLTDGTMFDGSSIAGWKAINESDMKLRPDLDSAFIDPFYQQTTM